jgi:hypothetical protein
MTMQAMIDSPMNRGAWRSKIDWMDVRDALPPQLHPEYYLTTQTVNWAYKSRHEYANICVHALWTGEQWEDIYGARYDSDGTNLDGETSRIIAWAPLPAAYEPEETNE